MPPEPLPWDRKDFFKERKHERSESLGSVARWRDSSSSHQGPREFARWGSTDFRRPPGHGKQGGWHLFSEETGHGYVPSRSSDKMLEDESCRPSVSRGDGKYGRNGRENRGSFSQRDWKVHSWEASNGSPNTPGRPHDVNNDQRSVDDMLMYPSHPHSDLVNTWDQLHLKDQHDKMGGVNGLGTGQRYERENSLGSMDWKPLKWTRSGSLSSRGSGFSHSSSSKSMGGVDSNEGKAELQPKNATPVQSPSGDAAACVLSDAPSEETTSRKKPRLGWGEGLAKYEKKKVEGPDVSVHKDGAVVSASNAELIHSLSSNLAEKSPRVNAFSDCASPATPSSVACSSSPGIEEKSFGKAANIDNDISNLCGSPSLGSQNSLEGFSFNLEKLDISSIANLGSSIVEFLQPDDPSSVDSSFIRSTAMNKLLIWKGDILKALEMTESEVDLLENELKSLKSESGIRCPCPAASSSLPGEGNAKSSNQQGVASNLIPRPAPLQIDSCGDAIPEEVPLCNGVLGEVHGDVKDEDVDSPGTATSKFVEPLSLVKTVSPSDIVKHGECSGNMDAIQSSIMEVKCLVPVSNGTENCASVCENASMFIKCRNGEPVSNDVNLHADGENRLCDMLLASNKESANRASEVFNKLLPRDHHNVDISEVTNVSGWQSDLLVKEKFAMRKQFLRFKERVLTLKFKAFQHLWKEDMRLLSIRKYRAKSQKRCELSLRTIHNGFQKHRSSIRSRFSSPAGNLSLVPTMEIINFTSKLLSDSQVKVYRSGLKMPALILDKKEKVMSRFISCNGLVEDPCAVEKERTMINPWLPEEREIFMDKLATFGKDFKKIASFLDHKTTADCVEFYYKNHKSDSFEKTKKKLDLSKQGKSSTNTYLVTSGNKWNREMNSASLDILGAATVMAARADSGMGNRHMCSGRIFSGGCIDSKISRGDDGIIERSCSFDVLGNERETVAADVLAGICGSLSSEAMSSCITSSVDPGEGYREWKCRNMGSVIKRSSISDVTQNVDDDSCSDESCGEMDPTDWTDEEKSLFIQAVSSYGKDFALISRCVRTRSRDQCKVFFSKARKCLGLDLIHPGSGTVGTPVSDDANGSGSDTEDACVLETSSVNCSDKLLSNMDGDMPTCVMKGNQGKSDPAGTMNLQTDLNRSEEENGMGLLHDKNSKAVETLVSEVHQTEGRPELDFEGDRDIMNGIDDLSESMQTQKGAVVLTDTETGRDQVTVQGISAAVSGSAGEAIDPCTPSLDALVETKAEAVVSSEGFGIHMEGQGLLLHGNNLNDKEDEKCTSDTSESLHQVSLKLDSMEKSSVSSLLQENRLAIANPVSEDSTSIQGEKMLNQDRLSSTHLQESRDKQDCKSLSREDHHPHQHLSSGHPSLNHVESSQILRGYPLQIPIKKEMNGDISCRPHSEVQSISKSEGNIPGSYLAQDCYLQKCNSLKPLNSAAEFPLLSQNLEQPSDHPRAHSRSLSDTEKSGRNGDFKLFGQILSNPSSTQKSNFSSHENENGTHHPKHSSKSSNLKFTGNHSADGNTTLVKFDRNNYLGLENVPIRSFGFWDGNRIQTGFSTLPDSAILLAKYPAAFSNYPASSSKMEQQALQAAVKNNERNLNGATVFSPREISSSNGVVDYQVHRSRDSTKVQPFTVDMKQRQEMFSEMQRRSGFEAISSLQQQGRGMVGMNVVGRGGGILVGGPGVSDPVAAIKMHYAKTDQYGGQSGSIIREEESWRGKGDIGR